MLSIEAVLGIAPVVPVLVVEDAAQAVPLARALVEGGLPVIEVTLRTAAALDVIREMSRVPGAVVGAGTVLNERHLHQAAQAGARFVVSPGSTPALFAAALAAKVPFLPGVANASGIMQGLEFGFRAFKFFPAVASGGIPALAALASVFGDARFCPTGGITAETAPAWLALEAVACVGGSWVVPKGALDFAVIEAQARKASSIGRRSPVAAAAA